LSIVVDPLVAADTRIAFDLQESMMRHFLTLALTPPTLPPSMMQPTASALLIVPACFAQALAPCLLRTCPGAIPLPVIAAPADTLLALTPRAI